MPVIVTEIASLSARVPEVPGCQTVSRDSVRVREDLSRAGAGRMHRADFLTSEFVGSGFRRCVMVLNPRHYLNQRPLASDSTTTGRLGEWACSQSTGVDRFAQRHYRFQRSEAVMRRLLHPSPVGPRSGGRQPQFGTDDEPSVARGVTVQVPPPTRKKSCCSAGRGIARTTRMTRNAVRGSRLVPTSVIAERRGRRPSRRH